jgi:hypothetical protein
VARFEGEDQGISSLYNLLKSLFETSELENLLVVLSFPSLSGKKTILLVRNLTLVAHLEEGNIGAESFFCISSWNQFLQMTIPANACKSP